MSGGLNDRRMLQSGSGRNIELAAVEARATFRRAPHVVDAPMWNHVADGGNVTG